MQPNQEIIIGKKYVNKIRLTFHGEVAIETPTDLSFSFPVFRELIYLLVTSSSVVRFSPLSSTPGTTLLSFADVTSTFL